MPSYLTSYKSAMTMFDEPVLSKDDLNHSVFLDVHTHSDYPEVNKFIDEIYSAHFAGPFTAVKREHSKVVLLHLYVVPQSLLTRTSMRLAHGIMLCISHPKSSTSLSKWRG